VAQYKKLHLRLLHLRLDVSAESSRLVRANQEDQIFPPFSESQNLVVGLVRVWSYTVRL
jgi:hypothetical protein